MIIFAKLQKMHMTDLTNNNFEELNKLVNQYTSLLEVIKINNSDEIYKFVSIIDFSIKYIKENYNNLSKEIKSWTVVAVKKMFLLKNITIKDAQKIIDDFISYWKTHYKEYCSETISSNDINRDQGFVFNFILKYK